MTHHISFHPRTSPVCKSSGLTPVLRNVPPQDCKNWLAQQPIVSPGIGQESSGILRNPQESCRNMWGTIKPSWMGTIQPGATVCPRLLPQSIHRRQRAGDVHPKCERQSSPDHHCVPNLVALDWPMCWECLPSQTIPLRQSQARHRSDWLHQGTNHLGDRGR